MPQLILIFIQLKEYGRLDYQRKKDKHIFIFMTIINLYVVEVVLRASDAFRA
jgi:hypothetical protein